MYTPKIIHIKISIGKFPALYPLLTQRPLNLKNSRLHKISIIGQINPPSSLYGACTANK